MRMRFFLSSFFNYSLSRRHRSSHTSRQREIVLLRLRLLIHARSHEGVLTPFFDSIFVIETQLHILRGNWNELEKTCLILLFNKNMAACFGVSGQIMC